MKSIPGWYWTRAGRDDYCEHCGYPFDAGDNCLACEASGVVACSIVCAERNLLGAHGCLPDSDPVGPFDTEAAALADAQSGAEEDAQ